MSSVEAVIIDEEAEERGQGADRLRAGFWPTLAVQWHHVSHGDATKSREHLCTMSDQQESPGYH